LFWGNGKCGMAHCYLYKEVHHNLSVIARRKA
jgi:hypothetical protein